MLHFLLEVSLQVNVNLGPPPARGTVTEGFAASRQWCEAGAGGLPGQALRTWSQVGKVGVDQSDARAYADFPIGPNY